MRALASTLVRTKTSYELGTNRHTRRLQLLAPALALALFGCRARSNAPSASASASAAVASSPTPSAVVLAASGDPTRLPENAELGRKSYEQWREHLREEEHNRRANYDRRKMPEHQQVVATLKDARARYDKASNEATLESLRKAMPDKAARVRELLQKIDKWGNSSMLLDDYEELLKSLTTGYPQALLAGRAGDVEKANAARADFDRRMKVIEAWLAEAREAEDE